ncbi:N-acetylmuramoyl-L-alanine amidase [Rhodocytophaga rosea]|uniref:N-acetylmuramoyl-L-alanine amidase n=1 Tax=Rhodocytophaga rosea TaxID=2704465 RepID=A0A6C0GIW7_9BACT|nr:N-acetylmuramoyl-L-alanine amidase [Rhodocytophaga rosea]QHT67867.1 N-acetylmuramoyl-L-alanine amidase [Rhodocytophaga rosea]
MLHHIWIIYLLTLGHFLTSAEIVDKPLTGKIICIDPGHGGTAATDSYRIGPTGEREEWINLRVAMLVKEMLEKKGAKVVLTRSDDSNISLDERVNLAKENKAHIFLSIHHNATADSTVNFPIVYFHGNASENQESVAFGKEVILQLRKALFTKNTPVSLVSDHTIFPMAGARVLRGTYGMPAILAEASFFTHSPEEQRLKNREYNQREAIAFVKALENYFAKPATTVLPKNSRVEVVPFKVFQEAERMSPIAKLWREDMETGKKLLQKQDSASLQQAYEYFTRSVRSFPDSYVAEQCHRFRIEILEKTGKMSEAIQEKQRLAEFYVPVE